MADVPDFRWVAFYYPEILAALIQLKRRSWPEHTEEDPADPVIQLYRAFAALGHLQSVRLDHAAREVFLPTARLRSSVIALARLVDYELAPAVPAETWLLATVSGSLSVATTLVRAHSVFATVGDADSPAVLWEYDTDEDLVGGPTGVFRVLEDNGGTITDVTSGLPLFLFATRAFKNDALYIGGDPVLAFNKVDLTISTAPGNSWFRWEYRDDRSGQPDAVTDNGGTITLEVDSVIGADAASPNGGEATGLQVVVTCLRTGVSETLEVDGSGAANEITTTGTLGQTTVSTSAADYLIETEWVELPGLEDGTDDGATGSLSQSGTLSFTLPFATDRRWLPSDPEGSGTSGYWIRARMCRAGDMDAPTLDAVAETRKTTWALTWDVRQGRRVEEKIGTTDGTASQVFELRQGPFLSLVELTIDGDPWQRVDNFLASSSYDRHFTLQEDLEGNWRVTLGDGATGKIPASAVAVVAVYRIGGGESGNVGPGTITRDRSGNSKIKAIENPQAATGWEVQEGMTAASLDALRVEIPASLRTRERAVTPADCEAMALEFLTADGSVVTTRALAVEEGNGPKTVALVCVGPGGAAPTVADMAELDAFFNGVEVGLQRIGGVLLANQELTSEAFVPVAVDVTATIKVLADYEAGAEERILASLGAILLPTATRQIQDVSGLWVDSGEWLWTWEGEIDPSVLMAAIYTATPGIVGITMAAPAAPITLGPRELPVPGVFTITVTPV